MAKTYGVARQKEHRVALDGWSLGLVVGIAGFWLINCIDLAIFHPWTWNAWRKMAGIPPLPLKYWDMFTRELFNFERWSLVILSAAAAMLINGLRLPRMESKAREGKDRTAPILFGSMTVVWLWLDGVLWVPSSREGFYNWIADVATGILVVGMLFGLTFILVRAAMRLFLVQS